jgi:hypothetical protein
LRAVQRNLDSSIDSLGARLKFYNILLFPIGLALAAVAVYLLQRAKRARKKG